MISKPFDMPALPASFEIRGGWVVKRLESDLGLTRAQAGGIVGNLGFESGEFKRLQEITPISGRGGYGWAQWTGPRRRTFEKWCATHHLPLSSDEANYGFLLAELTGAYRHTIDALKKTKTDADAVFSVGQTYERPGGTTPTHLPGFDARLRYARRAIAGASFGQILDDPLDIHPVLRLADPLMTGDAVRELQRGLSAKGQSTDVDGVFGEDTEAALIAFQTAAGLRPDGICGPITWTALRR